MIPVMSFADSSAKENSDIAFLKGLNLVGEETLADAPLTRIELARILYNIIFGDTKLHTDYYKDYYFTDVAEADKNVAAIMMDAGIMKGDGYGRFMPDATLTYNQLVKTIVAFLGYDYKAQLTGGYPSGYMILASQMKILLPWSVDGDAHVTYAAAASILKKALDVPMCVINDTVYEILDNENWLYHYMKIKTDYGIVNGNFLANLYGDKISGYDKISFKGKTMNLADNCYGIHDLIGMNARIYFKDDNTVQTIYYYEEGFGTSYTINDTSIGYATVDKVVVYDGDVDITYAISSDAEMIYNGSHLATFTADDVNPFAKRNLSGQIKLIDNNDDSLMDYVVVSAYETMLVGNVRNNMIYDFYGKKAPLNIKNYKERNIDICNILDEPVLPEKILSGYCVNVLKDKAGIVKKIVVTNDNFNGVIEEISYRSGAISALKVKGAEIEAVYGVFINSAGFDPAPGNNVKIYFDILGKAAILDLVNCEGEKGKFGVVVTSGTQGSIDKEVLIRIFADDGKMHDLKIAPNVKINGVNAKEENDLIKTIGTDGNGNVNRQILIFRESEGVLKEVILPTEPGTFNDSLYEFSQSGLSYIKGLANYGGKFTLSNNLKVFRIPDDSQRNTEKFYSVTTSIPDGNFKSKKLYGTNKMGLEANVVLVQDNPRGNVISPPSSLDREPILMIEKISEVLDDEGESIAKITCHTVNGYYYYYRYFYVKPEVLKAGCGGVYPEPGDILRTDYFYNNGEEVNWVKMLYDFSADKPAVSIPYNTLGSSEFYTYGTVMNKSGTTVKIKTYTAPGTPAVDSFEVQNVGGSYFKIIELSENNRGEITITSTTTDCILDEATCPGEGSELFIYTRSDAGFAVFVINRK